MIQDADRRWILGYGSLIWRPDFPHTRKELVAINGWTRRFWQWSTDHRGKPGRPGRVVTLVPAPGQVAALAFEVQPDVYDTVLARLDHREKGGYRRIRLAASSPTLGTLDVGTYVAGPGDPNYAGPAPIDEIARCIAERTGPSGTNREYLLELARALAQWGVRDAHVSQLAARVCAL